MIFFSPKQPVGEFAVFPAPRVYQGCGETQHRIVKLWGQEKEKQLVLLSTKCVLIEGDLYLCSRKNS